MFRGVDCRGDLYKTLSRTRSCRNRPKRRLNNNDVGRNHAEDPGEKLRSDKKEYSIHKKDNKKEPLFVYSTQRKGTVFSPW